MLYSPSTGGLYRDGFHTEIPADAVEITEEEYAAVAGRSLRPGHDGRPLLADAQPLSREQVEGVRLRAYADPINGSDRYFSEAARMQAMGESGWEAVRGAGVERYQAIQAEYPWPAEGGANV